MTNAKTYFTAMKRLFPDGLPPHGGWIDASARADSEATAVTRSHLARVVASREQYDLHRAQMAFHFGITPLQPVEPVPDDRVAAILDSGLGTLSLPELLHLGFDIATLQRLRDGHLESPYWVDEALKQDATPPRNTPVEPSARSSSRWLRYAVLATAASVLLGTVAWLGLRSRSIDKEFVQVTPSVVTKLTITSGNPGEIKDPNPTNVYSRDPFVYRVAVRDPLKFGWLYVIDGRRATLLCGLESQDGQLRGEYAKAFDSLPGYEYFVVIQTDGEHAGLGDKALEADWLTSTELEQLQAMGKDVDGKARASDLIRTALQRLGVTERLHISVDPHLHLSQTRPVTP